jgi:hypothetical protein
MTGPPARRDLEDGREVLRMPMIDQAVRRAMLLARRGESVGLPGGNPSTGVYQLTERIRESRGFL